MSSSSYDAPSTKIDGEHEWHEVTPGERLAFITSSSQTRGAYLVMDVVAAPRNGVPMHVHDNEEEHFIIVHGTVHIANGGEALDATAGMSVTIRRGVPHAWCNLSEAPVRMLVVFTPGHIEGLFRAASDPATYDMGTLPGEYGTRFVGPALFEDLYTMLTPRS
ncbi:MAG TPA: cupin domain-containing protein [Acetobacteraceae bacterium]|jgi:mannose-6-phosphate isomerase-like protein (cupin superfamily)|nr:cupin domain-containing protein [Acetobacteraceae bacterium]